MPYKKIRNLDGTYGVAFEPEKEAEPTQEQGPVLSRHQVMLNEQLTRNHLLHAMMARAIMLPKRRQVSLFDLSRYN